MANNFGEPALINVGGQVGNLFSLPVQGQAGAGMPPELADSSKRSTSSSSRYRIGLEASPAALFDKTVSFIARLRAYLFNPAVQFCTTVKGSCTLASGGTTAKNRCPSVETS